MGQKRRREQLANSTENKELKRRPQNESTSSCPPSSQDRGTFRGPCEGSPHATSRCINCRKKGCTLAHEPCGRTCTIRSARPTAAKILSVVRGLHHIGHCAGCEHPACQATHKLISRVRSHQLICRAGPGKCEFCNKWALYEKAFYWSVLAKGQELPACP